jgi:hypothetical protein
MATSTDDRRTLTELEEAARDAIVLPTDAHVIGEPVTVTRIRSTAVTQAGLLATCHRDGVAYELSFADVLFPTNSAGASIVARYRTWLGLAPFAASEFGTARVPTIETDDVVLGRPVELLVLACKSNALRCRLLGSTRELTLRTAIRDEIAGAIITVTPRKAWTHARHPYLSGDVAAVRFDASELGLVPLALHREDDPRGVTGCDGGPPAYRLERPAPGEEDRSEDLIVEAEACIDARDHVRTDALLREALAIDLRNLEAHAMFGERFLSIAPTLAHHHFALGVAIGSLTVDEDFAGTLPWGHLDNRGLLRCLRGFSRTLLRVGRREEAASAARRLLRLDPADPLEATALLAAIDSGKSWGELETAP